MKKTIALPNIGHPGDHLKDVVRFASFGGLFLSLGGTLFVWAGIDAFNGPSIVWEASLALNFLIFTLTWLTYIPFRKTDLLLGNGLLAILGLFNMFWMFGFAGFYFYFLFAPISAWPRAAALIGATTILLHRAHTIFSDIRYAFQKNKDLLGRMYCDEGTSLTFRREAVGLLEKARRERPSFRSIHLYAALFLAPFVLILNRALTPIFGDGHGVFMALAFLTLPFLQWGVEIFVQIFVTMIYYPIKLQKETGKPVLLKDW